MQLASRFFNIVWPGLIGLAALIILGIISNQIMGLESLPLSEAQKAQMLRNMQSYVAPLTCAMYLSGIAIAAKAIAMTLQEGCEMTFHFHLPSH